MTARRVGQFLLPASGVVLFGLLWALASLYIQDLPSPLKTWQDSQLYVLQPFEKRGEMDQGIARLASYSLLRVAKGFLLGAAIATPLGLLLGLSHTLNLINGKTILLVEDSAGLRNLATRVLEPAGYTVLGAAGGEEALGLLERQEKPVHLLLTDVVMPGMSGRQLAERLRQTHPQMKVLYVSGYTSDTVVRHGVLEAQASFLNKPFTAAGLLRKVREVLDS